MKREQIAEALALLAKADPQKTVDALVSAFDRMMAQRNELLEALKDLTTQIRVDHHADCLQLLPESEEFKAALAAIKRAEGES